jgi:hypothetical protein
VGIPSTLDDLAMTLNELAMADDEVPQSFSEITDRGRADETGVAQVEFPQRARATPRCER